MRIPKNIPSSIVMTAKRVRWSAWKNDATWLFVVISLFFGLILAIKTPLLWGGDETTHYARAFQISEGNVLSDRLPYPWGDYSYGGHIPATVHALIMHVNDDITYDSRATDYNTGRINDPASYKQFADKKLGTEMKMYFFPNSAPYSPVAYIPSAIALKIATIFNTTVGQSILLARIFGLLFFVACVAVGLRSLRGSRFAWVLFAVALIPMVLFQASIISGDATANALAILLVALIAKTFVLKKLERYETGLLMAATVMLPLVKPTYVFISLAALLVPYRYFAILPKLPAKWLKFGLIALTILLLALWTYCTKDVSDAIRLIGTGPRWMLISIERQLEFMLHHPWEFIVVLFRSLLLQDNNYLNGIFGQLGFIFVQVPGISIISSLLAMILALGISEKMQASCKNIIFGWILVAGGVASIFVTFYLTFSNVAEPIIEGVQGRYFLPFASLVLFLVGLVTAKVRFDIGKDNKTINTITTTITCLTICSLAFACIKFFYVLLG